MIITVARFNFCCLVNSECTNHCCFITHMDNGGRLSITAKAALGYWGYFPVIFSDWEAVAPVGNHTKEPFVTMVSVIV